MNSTKTPTTQAQPSNANPTLERALITVALATGAVLGFGGNFVTGPTQASLYAVSSLGFITGSVLLALRDLADDRRIRAAGFLVLALGEGIVMTAGAAIDAAGLAAFAAGATLYVPALLLVAAEGGMPTWVRAVTGLGALPFAAHVVLFHAGANPSAQGPAAGLGYTLLTLAIVGWIWSLYRPAGAAGIASAAEA